MKDADILKILEPAETYLKPKDALEKYDKWDRELGDRWINSGFTDFSMYQDPKYFTNLYLCWHYVSKGSLAGLKKFMEQNEPSWKNSLTFFDDYNGLGITTLSLLEAGVNPNNVFYFNDNPDQVNLFKSFCAKAGVQPPQLGARDKHYDVYMSLEIIEHYEKPLDYLAGVLATQPKYFVLTSNFSPKGNRIYPGHFAQYTNSKGEKVAPRKISREKTAMLKQDYEMVFHGYNGKPVIWKRK
jgi:hypothetical protein